MSSYKIEPTWLSWFKNNTFTANNTLVSLLTILFFITALVLFFWYIISDQMKIILLDKLEVLKIYSEYDPLFKATLKLKINNKDLNKEKYEKEILKRNEYNKKLFIDLMSWWFIIISFLIVLDIFYIVYYKKPLSKAELLLIMFVLTAFVAEIIFYIVIIREWKFIGDNEIAKELIKNY